MADELADMIGKERIHLYLESESFDTRIESFDTRIANVARSYFADILDAEAGQWKHHFGHPSPALTAIDHLRTALGIEKASNG